MKNHLLLALAVIMVLLAGACSSDDQGTAEAVPTTIQQPQVAETDESGSPDLLDELDENETSKDNTPPTPWPTSEKESDLLDEPRQPPGAVESSVFSYNVFDHLSIEISNQLDDVTMRIIPGVQGDVIPTGVDYDVVMVESLGPCNFWLDGPGLVIIDRQNVDSTRAIVDSSVADFAADMFDQDQSVVQVFVYDQSLVVIYATYQSLENPPFQPNHPFIDSVLIAFDECMTVDGSSEGASGSDSWPCGPDEVVDPNGTCWPAAGEGDAQFLDVGPVSVWITSLSNGGTDRIEMQPIVQVDVVDGRLVITPDDEVQFNTIVIEYGCSAISQEKRRQGESIAINRSEPIMWGEADLNPGAAYVGYTLIETEPRIDHVIFNGGTIDIQLNTRVPIEDRSPLEFKIFDLMSRWYWCEGAV